MEGKIVYVKIRYTTPPKGSFNDDNGVKKFYRENGKIFYEGRSVRGMLKQTLSLLYGGGRKAETTLSVVDRLRATRVLLDGKLKQGTRYILKGQTAEDIYEYLDNAQAEFFLLIGMEKPGRGKSAEKLAVDLSEIRKLLEYAGAFVGLSPGAKMGYGRFVVEEFREAELPEVTNFLSIFSSGSAE